MIRELVDKLNKYTKAYDEGRPIISDKEWDDIYFELEKLEKETGIVYPDSPTQNISYEVVNKLEKVKHNHQMLSLDKTKDWNEFLKYFSGKDVIGMLKLDGLTCSLRYVNGELVSAETRGNGEIGEDILHNAKVIPSIPKYISYKDELVVDGEIICSDDNFKEFSNEYANSRNFASGSIRLLDSKECSKRKLEFVVWNIVKGFDEENSFLNRLNNVEKLGFNIVPWTSSFDLDAKEFLVDTAKKLGYPIDGLVGRFDDIKYGESLGSTGHHSRAAFAFKFYDEEYDTILLDITYDVGRTGVLTPVAVFESVDDGVSITEKASIHNLSIMTELLGSQPYVGQRIKIAKMNQIIPQVVWGDEYRMPSEPILIPTTCPVCGGPTKIVSSDSGVKTLICDNPQCEGKLITKLDHFCGKNGLDIKGLSEATLEKLIDWGWVSEIPDLYTLKDHESEWKKQTGFGSKSVSNVLSAIEGSKNCKLSAFLSGIGIPEVGVNTAKDLARVFHSWDNFIKAVKDKEYHFWDIDGFGTEMDYAIKHFDYSIAEKLVEILNIESAEVPVSTSELSGLTVVITGKTAIYKNRDALKADVEAKGGKVAGSVSSKTNYLINNDNTSTSSKNLTAQKLGVPILTEEEFIEKFLK